MAAFSERLKYLRMQSSLSQQDLANKLNMTKQTISQYERGVREPDYDNLLALCDVFNVSSDYLLGKSDVTIRLLNSSELEKLNATQRTLRPDESQLLTYYNDLNDSGKEQAMVQVMNLTQIPAYIDKGELSYSSEVV